MSPEVTYLKPDNLASAATRAPCDSQKAYDTRIGIAVRMKEHLSAPIGTVRGQLRLRDAGQDE